MLAPGCPRTKGLRPHPGHLYKTLCAHLSSSQRSDLARQGSGTAAGGPSGKRSHLTAPPRPGLGPPGHSKPRFGGEGRVLTVSSLIPLELPPKPGDWTWRTGDARGCWLSRGKRTADAAGFSSPGGGVSSPAGSLKEICLKLGQAGGGRPRTSDGAQVAQWLALERKIQPWAAPAPAARPAPSPGGRTWTRLINFLNPSPSLPPRVFGLGNE